MENDNAKLKIKTLQDILIFCLQIFWDIIKDGFFDYWKKVYLTVYEINKFSSKWTLLTIIMTGLIAWYSIYIPIVNNRSEQGVAEEKVRYNEINFLNQLNIENLNGLKSRLNDLENEKNLIEVTSSEGKKFIVKNVQFWNDFWTGVYSNNFYIINKNYNYNKDMVRAYNQLVVNLEAVNSINSYINKLMSEANRDDNLIQVAILQEKEKEQSVGAFEIMIPIIVNSHYQFSNILDSKGLSLIESICKEDSAWVKENMFYNGCNGSGSCKNFYTAPINFQFR